MACCPNRPLKKKQNENLGTFTKFRLYFFGVIFSLTEGFREHKPLLFSQVLLQPQPTPSPAAFRCPSPQPSAHPATQRVRPGQRSNQKNESFISAGFIFKWTNMIQPCRCSTPCARSVQLLPGHFQPKVGGWIPSVAILRFPEFN